MAATCITGASVWDGEADRPFPATVVIEGNRIAG